MRDIYTAADRVLIALATEDYDAPSGLGIEWLKKLRTELQTICGGEIPLIPNPEDQDRFFKIMTTNFCQPIFQEGFMEFCDMIRSPWWQRGWIYQEFIVASEAFFLYRDASLNWRDLNNIIRYLVDKKLGVLLALWWRDDRWQVQWHPRLRKIPENARRPSDQRLSQMRQRKFRWSDLLAAFQLIERKHFWKGPSGLMGWLISSQGCRTSDRRDRVYAFLGLAYSQYNIIPDYSPSNTMSKLTLEVIRKVLEAEGSLNFLTYISLEERRWGSDLDDLDVYDPYPSWKRRLHKLRIHEDSAFNREKVATNNATNLTRVNASINDSGTILTVEGFRLDTLPLRVPPSTYRNSVPTETELITTRGLPIKRAWYSMYGGAPKYGATVCLWWFPGSSFVAFLIPRLPYEYMRSRRKRDYTWWLLDTFPIVLPKNDRDGWATTVTKLVLEGDIKDLLAMDGVTREVIEII